MKNLLAASSAALLLLACASTPNVQVETQIGDPRPTYSGQIRVFESLEALDEQNLDYDDVAVLRIDSGTMNEDKIRTAFMAKARELGADAVVLRERDRKIFFQGGQQTTSIIFRALAIDILD